MATKVILDCDTGVDDTMAILLAALHPDIDLLAVGSVWGNVDAPLATRNSIHTLEMCGRADVPVAMGACAPINQRPLDIAYFVHGRDGQGNRGTGRAVGAPVPGTAAEQIVRVCREHPGEVEIIAVGPLTNLALALGLDPDLPGIARGVTIMGGTALAPGNVSEVAEANIWHDPEAAAAVFNAPWLVTLVGLDVTMRTLLRPGHIDRLRAGGTIAQYLARITEFYTDFCARESFGEPLTTMHDALAVAIGADVLAPTLAPVVRARVDTSDGPGRGQTLCDLRGMYRGYPTQQDAHCRVVLDCDTGFGDAFVDLVVAAGDARIDVSEPR